MSKKESGVEGREGEKKANSKKYQDHGGLLPLPPSVMVV
jgi:hypothetical protein